MGSEMHIGSLVACVASGILGAGLGAWIFSQTVRAQLEAQRQAFELAREKAQRDLQQTLLCVPQWVQRAARTELELLGRQHAGRHEALLREQQRWQAEQDERRQAEWRALRLEPVGAKLPPAPQPDGNRGAKPTPAPSPAPARPPGSMVMRPPPPAPVESPELPESELSDEEIDALPPDLPPPLRPRSKKMSAPGKPVLRSI
ncbi:hypothetical protein M2282_004127 [Variovorax boronicumulans]|uniref:hypothetical protein n=1 Tax=Variovorax boronicumulans TaxID=436515 RepID=UPI0024768B43|nr:hypothetical protein [Variovorax boronicumulans]MDH6168963.1 hypothetical protein [Variovorax boronicumulans]